MEFRFIGGSMGAVVGEKITRAIDRCIEKELPLVVVVLLRRGAHDGGHHQPDAALKDQRRSCPF